MDTRKPFKKPTLVKPETLAKLEKVIEAIAIGIPNTIACQANGMSEPLFYDWIKQGVIDCETENETEYAKFVRKLRKVEMESIARSLTNIRSSEKSHRGDEWFLERRYWRHFGMNVGMVELGEDMEEMKRVMRNEKVRRQRKQAKEDREEKNANPSLEES